MESWRVDSWLMYIFNGKRRHEACWVVESYLQDGGSLIAPWKFKTRTPYRKLCELELRDS